MDHGNWTTVTDPHDSPANLSWIIACALLLPVAGLGWAAGVSLAGAVYIASGWPESQWEDGYPHTGGTTAITAVLLGIGILIIIRRLLTGRRALAALIVAAVSAAVGFVQGVNGMAL